jgi:hypothetical protein
MKIKYSKKQIQKDEECKRFFLNDWKSTEKKNKGNSHSYFWKLLVIKIRCTVNKQIHGILILQDKVNLQYWNRRLSPKTALAKDYSKQTN